MQSFQTFSDHLGFYTLVKYGGSEHEKFSETKADGTLGEGGTINVCAPSLNLNYMRMNIPSAECQ